MTTLQQVPADLDIEVGQGDDLAKLFDFDISLAGYTFVSKVIKADGAEQDVAVADTDLANGQITLTWSDTLISNLGPGSHRWYLAWTTGGNTRRVFAGDFIVKAFV